MGFEKVFRTYLMGDGKRCVDKHKGKTTVRSWEECQSFDSFGGVMYEDFVDISFDSKDMFDAFLDMAERNEWRCLCLPSAHGGHSYWKNNKIVTSGKDKKLAVGLVADIHKGETYIPLRVNGIDRFPPVYDILPGEEYDFVPDELLPVNTEIDLWKMCEGEGRNDALYKYILILQSQLHLGEDSIRRVLNNTNDFVLASPVNMSEFQTITRDESFQKPIFFDGKTFLFDHFAAFIKNNNHVLRVNGQLHIYRDGVYIDGYREIESIMVSLIPNLRDSQRREVLKYLELIVDTGQQADARYIAFKNGVYDVVTDNLFPFSPDLVITNRVPWNYNPDAYNELTDSTLNKLACGDESIRALLEECVGYCFFRRNELGKAFILTGDKSNGKSTFLDLLKNVLGEENISALDLKELGDRFSTSMMFGRLANIGDDIGDDFLQGTQVATFKKIVTGNRVKAERKGQDPFEFNPYIKLLFAANDIPRMKDKTGAVLRRLVIIPFNATFSKNDPDYRPFIKYELAEQSSIEYLIALGIEGLKRVLANNDFSSSDAVSGQLSAYEEENNPIIAFINDQGIDAIENESTTDVYKRYQVFCADNAMTPMSKIVFSKHIAKRLDLEVIVSRVGNKNIRMFKGR